MYERFFMHISLTGNLGSGKSTVCKILHGQYGYEIFSTGVIMRNLAQELGITVLEMNERAKSDPSIDKMIDESTMHISAANPDKDLVFDSRLAWHFAKDTFKVFLSVDREAAAKRVLADKQRGPTEDYSSAEDAFAQLTKRAEEERRRYIDIYGVDYFDMTNYDLVIDTTDIAPEAVVEKIMTGAKKIVVSG
jgi:cytidylate kinase